MIESVDELKLKSTDELLCEIQRIAFRIRMDNMAAQERIDKRVCILRAREDPELWSDTEFAVDLQKEEGK